MSRPITFCCNNMSIYDTASNHFPIMCAWAEREERRLANKKIEWRPEEKYKCRYRLCLMGTEAEIFLLFSFSTDTAT